MVRNIKIAHVFLPSKFASNLIKFYSCLPSVDNYFCVYTEKHKSSIQENANNVIEVKKNQVIECINRISPDILLMHSITIPGSIIRKIPRNITLIWHSWGHDIYGDSLDCFYPVKPVKINLYKPRTRVLYNKKFKFKDYIFNIYFRLFYRGYYRALFSRVDYISCILPNEKFLLNASNINAFKYIQLCYASPTKITQLEYKSCEGTNILIGNSASLTNNHLDIFAILDNIGVGENVNLVVPLSYGSKKYAKNITYAGKVYFGDNFVPLVDFLPMVEYDTLLKSCSYAIFGHLRQQAIGNILLCLTQGTKVFLYKDSIAYKYFKSLGCILFSIDDELDRKSLQRQLSDEDKRFNFNIIKNKYYSQYQFTKIESKFRSILNNK